MRRSIRRKKEALDLDITSLLDILVILLVFLLNNYSASEFKFEPIDNIDLATSNSQQMAFIVPTIQVNKERVLWLDNEKIGKLNSISKDKLEGKLAEIKVENEKKLELIKNKVLLAERKKRIEMINIIMDKDLNYQELDRVMTIAANSGHTKFKFIVQTLQ